jgi:hypothetical protein
MRRQPPWRDTLEILMLPQFLARRKITNLPIQARCPAALSRAPLGWRGVAGTRRRGPAAPSQARG